MKSIHDVIRRSLALEGSACLEVVQDHAGTRVLIQSKGPTSHELDRGRIAALAAVLTGADPARLDQDLIDAARAHQEAFLRRSRVPMPAHLIAGSARHGIELHRDEQGQVVRMDLPAGAHEIDPEQALVLVWDLLDPDRRRREDLERLGREQAELFFRLDASQGSGAADLTVQAARLLSLTPAHQLSTSGALGVKTIEILHEVLGIAYARPRESFQRRLRAIGRRHLDS